MIKEIDLGHMHPDDAALIERLREEIARLARTKQGHEQPCYYCSKPCDSLAANPSMWPIPLCHADDPGRVKWHHIGCVQQRLASVEILKAALHEIQVGKIQADNEHPMGEWGGMALRFHSIAKAALLAAKG